MKLLPLLCTLFLVSMLQAQTTTERLETAVRSYNTMRDSISTFRSETLTEAQITYVRQTMEAGVASLDALINELPEGNAERTTARYFRMNYQYEYGFVLGMKGRNKEADVVFEKIEADIAFFGSPAIYPLSYKFDGKNYSIKYENFRSTLTEFYAGYGEVCANLGNSEKSLNCLRKSLQLTENRPDELWIRYVTAQKIVTEKKKLNQFDAELVNAATILITVYSQLDSNNRSTIAKNKYPTYVTGYNRINDVYEKNPSLIGNGEVYARMAPLLLKENDKVRAEEYYENAMKYNYPFGRTELEEIINLADRRSNTTLGRDATKRFERLLSTTDCAGFRKAAEYYELFEDKTNASAARQKATNCEAAEEQRRQAEKRRQRRNNRDFLVYAAVYPLPVLTRFGDYRDFGGVVGIGGRRLQIEVSGKLINRNFVIADDLSYKSIDAGDQRAYWDGYRAHVSFRFKTKNASSDNFFVGPLFEVVQRNYQPLWSSVTDANNILLQSEKRFEPTERSYVLYLNYGSYVAKNYLFFEYFMGFGLHYSTFDGGGVEYNNDAYQLSVPLLENRKPTRLGPALRMGITLGFCSRKR